MVEGKAFVVGDTSAVPGKSGRCSFDDPAPGQDHESAGVVGFAYGL